MKTTHNIVEAKDPNNQKRWLKLKQSKASRKINLPGLISRLKISNNIAWKEDLVSCR
jgi:hypothetical protein